MSEMSYAEFFKKGLEIAKAKYSHHTRRMDTAPRGSEAKEDAAEKRVFFSGVITAFQMCQDGAFTESFLRMPTEQTAYALNTLRTENAELKAQNEANAKRLADLEALVAKFAVAKAK